MKNSIFFIVTTITSLLLLFSATSASAQTVKINIRSLPHNAIILDNTPEKVSVIFQKIKPYKRKTTVRFLPGVATISFYPRGLSSNKTEGIIGLSLGTAGLTGVETFTF